MIRTVLLALLGVCALSTSLAQPVALAQSQSSGPQPKTPIQHFIVLMQENHSFDNYFGTYPGANGIPPGVCMPVNPTDPKNTQCVKPFRIGDRAIVDLGHNANIQNAQFNNGSMNGFIYAFSQLGGGGTLTMGYYDDRDLPFYWNVADEYVLYDRFFTSAAGGSVWNHLYWVTGTPGNTLDSIPPGGFGDLPTIFDRLEERGISWKFYVQNYDPQINYRTRNSQQDRNRSAQVIWVPLLDYGRYIDNPKLFSHIVDAQEYFDDLKNNTLPAVAYMIPSGASEHPPGSLQAGQKFVRNLINQLMESDSWSSSAFMWAYDDWGGWYDHVSPPQVDRYGYGFRTPALLVSPYARRHYIDSTQLDFTSYLKFIEDNWDLRPLSSRDAKAQSIDGGFDFSQPPRPPIVIPRTRDTVQRPEPKRMVLYVVYSTALTLAAGSILLAAIRTRSNNRYPPAMGQSPEEKKP